MTAFYDLVQRARWLNSAWHMAFRVLFKEFSMLFHEVQRVISRSSVCYFKEFSMLFDGVSMLIYGAQHVISRSSACYFTFSMSFDGV